MIRIAINGLGRIGRAVFKIAMQDPHLTLVAVNDHSDIDQLIYLLRHDSVYGSPGNSIARDGDGIRWADEHIHCSTESDPARLPWSELDVDVVVEATGVFRQRTQAARHLQAGAGRVIITAPSKDADVTLCMGVNEHDYDPEHHKVISNASCTTNCLAAVAKVLDETFGIETGFLTTVHAVTGGQRLVDQFHEKVTRGRSALTNIVPTTTGAARTTGQVLPALAGRMDGLAMRVPVIDGSVVDFVAQTRKAVDAERVNQAFRDAAKGALEGIVAVSEEELVSSDIIGSGYSALVNLASTMTVHEHTVKVLAWYDNEWGYAQRVTDAVHHICSNG